MRPDAHSTLLFRAAFGALLALSLAPTGCGSPGSTIDGGLPDGVSPDAADALPPHGDSGPRGDAGDANTSSFSTPLRLHNADTFDRVAEPVTTGVPLPESLGLTDVRQLRVLDSSGQTVPAQFRVLSRWGALADATKPLRWVLVDFQADVPAGVMVTYQLANGGGGNTPAGITVQDAAAGVTVNTGAITATVSKTAFNLFDTVSVGNTPVVTSSAQNGFQLTGVDGTVYSTANAAPTEVAVEESGPLRTVVRVRGQLADTSGRALVGGNIPLQDGDTPQGVALTYTARLTFYRNEGQVRVSFTLENDGNLYSLYGNPGQNNLEFRSLYARLAGAFQGGKTATFETGPVSFTTESLELLQTHTLASQNDERQNFAFALTRDGTSVATGQRANGVVSVSDGTRGIAAGMDLFWQLFPKSNGVRGDALSTGLWPELTAPNEWGDSTHVFAAGWHRTHDLLYQFFTGTQDARVMQGFQHPLIAAVDPRYFADTNAIGLNAPGGLVFNDPAKQEVFDRYDAWSGMFADASNGSNLSALRESRTGGIDLYGEEYFGNVVSQAGWGTHYDWAALLYYQFLRTGNEQFAREARWAARITRDEMVIHNPGTAFDGMWWFEGAGQRLVRGSQPHVFNSQFSIPIIRSHSWNGGLVLDHLLTGDPRPLEDAARVAAGAMAFWNAAGIDRPSDQTRAQGWSALMQVNLYTVDGDVQHLRDAVELTQGNLMFTEALDSANPQLPCGGSHRGGAWTSNVGSNGVRDCEVVETFQIYPIEPIVETHYWASRAGINVAPLEAFLERWSDYMRNSYFANGTTAPSGNYLPWGNQYSIPFGAHADPAQANSMYKNDLVANGVMYTSWLLRSRNPTKAAALRDWARQLERDKMFYGFSVTDATMGVSPSYRAPVALDWAPTMAKVWGWLGHAGRAYWWVEQQYLLAPLDANATPVPWNADVTPPVISAVNTGSPTNMTDTVTWTTDEPSPTWVEYTTDNWQFGKVFDMTPATSHQAVLSDYSYVTSSGKTLLLWIYVRDANGNVDLDASHSVVVP